MKEVFQDFVGVYPRFACVWFGSFGKFVGELIGR
jgi:hypothetical protein